MSAVRRALLTGASGFIGGHLARRLLADGWQVHLVLRAGSQLQGLAAHPALLEHRHDGSTEDLIRIVGAVQPDTVFHLASLFLARHQPQDVEPLVRSNILFSTQLAEAMAQAGVRQLVNTGTSWQHYENQPYSPVCLYAALKQGFDAVLRYYAEALGMQVITLKLFDTYGPGDLRPKLLHLFQRAALSGETLAMSPGAQQMDLVYVDDVVDAFVQAAERLRSGAVSDIEEYAVSSGAPLSLQDLARQYEQASGRALHIDWGGRPYRPREVMQPWSSYALLPGWQPKVGLADGIRRSLS